jgi:hypothetical protein
MIASLPAGLSQLEILLGYLVYAENSAQTSVRRPAVCPSRPGPPAPGSPLNGSLLGPHCGDPRSESAPARRAQALPRRSSGPRAAGPGGRVTVADGPVTLIGFVHLES